MTQTWLPLAKSQISTPQQWSKMARNWLGTGVIKGLLNELQVYADSTGMQIKIKSGQAYLIGHFYESDVEEVLAINAADSTNPRIDRIIVRLDYVSDSIQLAVLQGSPATSPVAPALTQNTNRWEISLAQIRVNAAVGTIASGNVTDERIFTSNYIESGANANGSYVKYPDGTMMCWQTYSYTVGDPAVSVATDFISRDYALPATFYNNAAAVSVTAYNNYQGIGGNGVSKTLGLVVGSNWRWGAQFNTQIPLGSTIYISVQAVGRWRK